MLLGLEGVEGSIDAEPGGTGTPVPMATAQWRVAPQQWLLATR